PEVARYGKHRLGFSPGVVYVQYVFSERVGGGVEAEIIGGSVGDEQRVGHLDEFGILNRHLNLVPEPCFEQFMGVEYQVKDRHEVLVLLYVGKDVILEP